LERKKNASILDWSNRRRKIGGGNQEKKKKDPWRGVDGKKGKRGLLCFGGTITSVFSTAEGERIGSRDSW